MTTPGFALRLFAALVASVPICALQAQEPTAFEQGVAARQAGNPAEAARLLAAWLEDHPSDVDARLQLAYADYALGRLARAESGFRAVLAAAPDYTDAQAGLDLVARARREDERPTLLTVEGALSDLSAGRSDWRELGATLSVPTGRATAIEGRATWYRRFDRDDLELAALVTGRVGENLWLRGGIGGTPGADFRPEVSVTGGLDWRLAAGDKATVLTFDARYEDFPAQKVVTLSPGLVQYLAGGKAWITVRAFGVLPEGRDMQVGFLARGDIEPAERTRIFAGVSSGPDTDLGVVTDVTTVFGGAEVPLGDRLSLLGSLTRETRKGPADRTEFRLGIKARL